MVRSPTVSDELVVDWKPTQPRERKRQGVNSEDSAPLSCCVSWPLEANTAEKLGVLCLCAAEVSPSSTLTNISAASVILYPLFQTPTTKHIFMCISLDFKFQRLTFSLLKEVQLLSWVSLKQNCPFVATRFLTQFPSLEDDRFSSVSAYHNMHNLVWLF